MSSRRKQAHLVVVGSTIFDLIVKADRVPRAGEVVLGTDLRLFSGGKGANRAVAATRLGAATTFISAVGADVLGEYLVQGLERQGIDTSWVKRDPRSTTGCSWIAILPGGNNATFVDAAANFSMTAADVERAAEVIEQSDALAADLEIPFEAVEAALRLARRAGKLTVLDAGPPRPCPAEILRLADVVSPNEPELEALTGDKVRDLESARSAARKLVDAGVKTLVVKMGASGAILVTAGGSQHFPAHEVQVTDPTGAGDAFTTALTVELAEGATIDAAVDYANRAGALAVTRLGAQSGMPARGEIEAFARGLSAHTEHAGPGGRPTGASRG